MPVGGKREGAGRPKGGRNAKLGLDAQKLASEGITPLDFLLGLLRDESQDHAVRVDAAKSAAPYIHPRLSAVEAKVQIENHEAALAVLK